MTTDTQPDWNVDRFGSERPVCRHDFRAVVAERDRYRAALERVEAGGWVPGDPNPDEAKPLGRIEMASLAREALDQG